MYTCSMVYNLLFIDLFILVIEDPLLASLGSMLILHMELDTMVAACVLPSFIRGCREVAYDVFFQERFGAVRSVPL
jgi:hypothetical protein